MMKSRIAIAILATILTSSGLSAKPHMPNVQCTATGARCAADCPTTMQGRCYSSATECHCECVEIGGDGHRRWGPVTANGPADISSLQRFSAYLTGTLRTPGGVQLAADVDATITAIQNSDQIAYEVANNSYADHWESLPGTDRDTMLDWVTNYIGIH